ncbi:phosphotransferase family protein [Planctomycetota bacterium]
MGHLLPKVSDDEGFEALRPDPTVWTPAIEALAARHGLSGTVRMLAEGSCVLAEVGGRWIVKLFDPWSPERCATEQRALSWLAGVELPATTPELVAHDDLEGWSYLVMTRLPGCSMDAAWPHLGHHDRARLAQQLGEFAAALHRLPLPADGIDADWPAFVERQKRGCLARHRVHGALPDTALDALAEFIDRTDLTDNRQVFLHTELTSGNALIERRGDGWALSGVVDFEPAAIGAPEYELPGIAIFVARGNAEVLRAALRGYGVEADVELARRLTAWTLLHRYSHMGFFLRVAGLPTPNTLDELQRSLFPGVRSPRQA